MRLLITGGAGFIGSNFLRMALREGSRIFSKVTVLDALTYAGNVENFRGLSSDEFEFVQGDICNFELVKSIVQNVDLVINFAAESHVDRSILGPIKFMETNVVGLTNLLEATRTSNVLRFLQVSTDEVYGSIDLGSWTELEPLMPNSPYSASKAAGDLIVRAYRQTFGLDVILTRSCNNYGPYQHSEKLIPHLISRAIQNLDLPIYGDGSNVREWIHVEDHCAYLLEILIKGVAGEVYNIGTQFECSNISIANKVLQLIPASKSEIKFVKDRLGHDKRYALDCTKLRKSYPDIDIRPFEVGLSQTVKWYAKHHQERKRI